MLSSSARNIIIKALQIRKMRGEDPVKVLETYKNLSASEKAEILETLRF